MAGSTLSNRPVEDMILAGRRLCVAERELIDSRLREDVSLREIALELGRAPSTVSREVNASRPGWPALTAQPAGRSLPKRSTRAVFANGTRGLAAGAYKLLPSRQRRRLSRDARKARSGRPGPLGAFKPLTARPAITRDRDQPGHWEGDLERHEALSYRPVVKGHRLRLVAAGR